MFVWLDGEYLCAVLALWLMMLLLLHLEEEGLMVVLTDLNLMMSFWY